MDRSLQSLTKTVLNYTRVFELRYGVSFVEASGKDIVDDMIPSRYLLMQSRLSYIPYGGLGSLMTKDVDVMPLLDSLCEGREDGTELVISHLDSEVLQATQGSRVALVIEAANFQATNLKRRPPSTPPASTDSTSS